MLGSARIEGTAAGAAKENNMPWILMTLLTILMLGGIFLATVAGVILLVVAVVIVARRQRTDAVPAVESAN
jgi:phage shock protein PspC (stress-responsive transcriptional regulator)